MTGQGGSRTILFLVSSMGGGGAERVAALLCNHWAETGNKVILMPTYSGRGDCVYPLHDAVRLDYLADRVKGATSGLKRFRALRAAIRDIRPDVIISFLTHVNVAALVASLGFRIPVIVSERNYPPLDAVGKVWRIGRKHTYRLARSVVAQTEDGRRWIVENCPGSKVDVIPNPIVWPLPKVTPHVQPSEVVADDRRVLLAVGRLHPQKAFDCLISAFAKIAPQHPDWDLVILGEGGDRGKLEAQRKAAGLEGRVFLPGRAGNVADWYERAQIYILSSRFEGFPNTLLEAMASGLPVISMDCPTGPSDMIRHGENGYLIPNDADEDGMARAISDLMTREQEWQRLSAEARKLRDRYSITNIITAWDRLIDRLLQGKA